MSDSGRERLLAEWERDPHRSYIEFARAAGVTKSTAHRVLYPLAGPRSPGRAPNGAKQRILAEWERDPSRTCTEIARRAGCSQPYAWLVVSTIGGAFPAARQRRRIINAWRRTPAASYGAVARLLSVSPHVVSRTLKSIGIDRSNWRPPSPVSDRLRRVWRADPDITCAEAARRARASITMAHTIKQSIRTASGGGRAPAAKGGEH